MTKSFGPSSVPTASPTPISWPPSQFWDGDDGTWSSFALRVGEPEQVLRVLPSTAGQVTWAVIPQGCPPSESGAEGSLTCVQSRAGLFNISQSTSWQYLGNYSLGLELTFGDDDLTATYGTETVALGFANANGGPTLHSQVVAGFETLQYYTGLFGLGSQPTNLTNYTNPRPSFLSVLKTRNLIPSLSWAYTAGAKYRSKGFFGSLTFGGRDLSRFLPNNVSFSFAPDISRDLVVGLESITSTSANGSAVSLLSSTILAFIDSTVPSIILPEEACLAFRDTFGLTWNDSWGIYVVDNTRHQNLITHNPNFTFRIANSNTGGPTVDIVMPYASFDLIYPLASDDTRYFPLQRAENESQYTLGRTFLQEAYLITNYEYNNFSVFQSRFEEGLKENIIANPSLSSTTSTNHPPGAVVIGVSLSALAFFLLSVFGLMFAIRRWRQKHSTISNGDTIELSDGPPNPEAVIVPPMHEIGANSLCRPLELYGIGMAELQDGRWISELEESAKPIRHELMANHGSARHIMVQDDKPRKRFAIYVSNGFSTEIWPTVGTSSDQPVVETVISTSAPRRFPGLSRSLPPTPISESPQIWPVVAGFNHRSSTQRGLQTVSSAASIVISVSGRIDEVDPRTTLVKLSKDKDRSDDVPLIYTSVGIDTANPPGERKSSIIGSSHSYEDDIIESYNFF